MSVDTPSVMHSSLHIWAIWLERLFEGLELRLGRLAVHGGQVERGDSEEMACEGGGGFTGRVVPREQLREVVDL